MRITVLDNDTSLLRSLRIILTRQGHEVQCFTDPLRALDALGMTAEPDALLVDLVMPQMTGLEFLAAASTRLPRHCRKAIITGHAERLGERELAAAGVDALFPKPLELALITAFLRGVPVGHACGSRDQGPKELAP